jgi:two-component system, NarL family, nitrate/nitrite response regulator NarL
MRVIRMVIADRHALILGGLASVLRAEADFAVVAICQNGATCVQAIRDLSPDVALLGDSKSGPSGLDILAITTSEHLSTRVVFLASSLSAPAVLAAVARGSFGLISTEATPEVLIESLRLVAAGTRLVPQGCPGYDALLVDLTNREREIVHLVSEGLSNKEIGRLLDLCEGTVKVHLHRVYRKLAIRNRTVLASVILSAPAAIERSRAGGN